MRACLPIILCAWGPAAWAGGFGNTAPAVGSVVVSPSPIPALGTALISCSASDSDGTIQQMRVTVSAGTLSGGTASELLAIAPGPAVTGTVAWATPAAGTYAVTCAAADNGSLFGGALVATLTVSVNVVPSTSGSPPIVGSLTTSEPRPFPSQRTQLAVTATDPDGDPLTFSWSSTGGTLVGSGTQVDWLAPAGPGAFVITVAVSDTGGNSTTSSLSVEVVWGRALTPLTASAGFSPSRLAVDAMGSYWVADARAGTLVLISPFGQTLRTLALPGRLGGVGIGGSGQLYVGDLARGAVNIYSPLGERLGHLGTGAGEFITPVDVAVDPTSGTVYVADLEAQVVKAFAAGGAPISTLVLDAGFPAGLALERQTSTIFVTDGANGTVEAFSRSGAFLRTIGTFGSAPGSLTRAAGVALDSAGNLYAVDGFQSRVSVFATGGGFRAFMSSGAMPVPSGAAFDRGGRLVVANPEAGRLEVFALPGSTAPEVACPADLTVTTAPGSCAAPLDDATLSTRAPGQGGTAVPVPGTVPAGNVFKPGTTLVSWEVTDSRANVFECAQRVTVRDEQPPAVICAGAVTLKTAPGFCGAAVSAPVLGAATDNCGAVTEGGLPPGGFFPLGPSPVKFTARDGAGNAATCEQTVTVVDGEAPRVSCPADVETAMEAGVCGARVATALTTPTAADNCSAVTVSEGLPGELFPAGVTSLIHRAIDSAGNDDTCTQSVRVRDAEPPLLTCGAPMNLGSSPSLCGRLLSEGELSPTASDNCSVSVANDGPGFGLFPAGTTTLGFVATDPEGNGASCTRTVTITDVEVPSITCPPDVLEFTLPGTCDALVARADLTPLVTDNCGASVTSPGTPTGDRFARGVTVITHTARDAAGSTASCTQRVVVTSVEAEALSCPPRLVVSTDPGRCHAQVDPAAITPQLADPCGASLVVLGAPAGRLFPAGTTTLTHRATSRSGWTAECTQEVVVEDREAPVLSCPAVVAQAPTSACQAPVPMLEASATDNCGELTLSPPQPAQLVAVGTWLRSHRAADPAGNVGTCAQRVTVADRTPPTVDCPDDLTLECTAGGAEARFSSLASDNCSAQVACTLPSGTLLDRGTWRDDCVASDPSGNAATCGFWVRVQDTLAPVLTSADFTIFVQQPVFLAEVGAPLRACAREPALPFELRDCVSAARDQCVGPLDPMAFGSISRVEFWAQAAPVKVRSPSAVPKLLQNALKDFDRNGCQRFALTGHASAALPFEQLADPDHPGLYRVHYVVADGNGPQSEASCEVRLLRSETDAADLAALPLDMRPAPLGCVVCVGTGCGACPAPAVACKSAQRCAPSARTSASYRQEHCVDACGQAADCAAQTLACLAADPPFPPACSNCGEGGH